MENRIHKGMASQSAGSLFSTTHCQNEQPVKSNAPNAPSPGQNNAPEAVHTPGYRSAFCWVWVRPQKAEMMSTVLKNAVLLLLSAKVVRVFLVTAPSPDKQRKTTDREMNSP